MGDCRPKQGVSHGMWSVPGSGLSPNRPRAPQCKDTVQTMTGPSAAMVFTCTSFLEMGLFLQTKLRSHCLVEAGERPWPSQHPSLLPWPGSPVYMKHGLEMLLDTQQAPWIISAAAISGELVSSVGSGLDPPSSCSPTSFQPNDLGAKFGQDWACPPRAITAKERAALA